MQVMERPQNTPMTGTKCEHCEQGWLVVYATRRKGGNIATKYYRCHACHEPATESETVVLPPRRNRSSLLGQRKPDFD